MKSLLFMVLLSSGAIAQQQVYNVQKYCIDEKPFHQNQCDIAGNEYSFVFVDTKKNEVVLFLSDLKIGYTITSVAREAGNILFKLSNLEGPVEMEIGNNQTSIRILERNRHIRLTVGKSTKL